MMSTYTLDGALRRSRGVVRVFVPVIFVIALLITGAMTLPGLKPGMGEFDHHYAAVPALPTSYVAGVAATPIPASNDLVQVTIRDLSTLAQALPPEAIIGSGRTYHLLQPVLISQGARVDIAGGGTLVLDNGSYLEVGPGGKLSLSNLTITATGPSSNRGFLADVGSLMILNRDRLIGLGRFATNTRGVSFEAAQTGSGLTNSYVRDGADGVFATLSPGILIVGNDIEASRLDGIQIQGRTRNPVVVGNHVVGSGGDGIALSSGIVEATLISNNVVDSTRYGILISATSGPLSLERNTVSNSYDGIVCDNAQAVTVHGNWIDHAQRFGIRLSGQTRGVTIGSNHVTQSAVGVYASRGPSGNLIVDSQFDENGENVRIRTSAPHNVVIPHPLHSELRSP